MLKKTIINIFKPTPFKIGCIVVLLSCLLFYSFGKKKPALLTALDNQMADTMFRWRGATPTTGEVVIVDIDEKSLRNIGQWPWPRDIVADLVKNIHAAGARVVGFDIFFPEKDRTSPVKFIDDMGKILEGQISKSELELLRANNALDHDVALGNAVSGSLTVLGYAFQCKNDGLKLQEDKPFPSINIRINPSGYNYDDLSLISAYRAIVNVEEIAQAETEGFFNVFPDRSGMIRKVPLFMALDGVPYPSLAFEITRSGLSIEEVTLHISQRSGRYEKDLLGVSLGDYIVPTDEKGQLTVNFRGPANSFKYVSAYDILTGKMHEALTYKFVLIGTSAEGLHDIQATPFSNTCPGVEIHANIIDNIIAKNPFSHDVFTEIGMTYALLITGGMLLSALLAYTGPLAGGIVGLAFIALTIIGNYNLFFLNNEIVGVTYPLLTVITVFCVVTLFNYFLEGKEKRFIHGAFGHYVSPSVVSQLIKSPNRLSLAGEQKKLTVFFSDIRGFTGISEEMDSVRLSRFMNDYFTAMSNIIIENNGMVDKFIGDAIMAIWGAPLDDYDHAAKAVRTALSMMERLKKLRSGWTEKRLQNISIGIGINTGNMVVGNFGSNWRFDYTVIGDNVNIASRLEKLNKIYGTNILITEFTKGALNNRFFCRFIDTVRLRGKGASVKIYEPIIEGEPDSTLRDEIIRFEKALKNYQDKNFESAFAEIDSLQKNNPHKLYALYLDRIDTLRKKPPDNDWDGVFIYTGS